MRIDEIFFNTKKIDSKQIDELKDTEFYKINEETIKSGKGLVFTTSLSFKNPVNIISSRKREKARDTFQPLNKYLNKKLNTRFGFDLRDICLYTGFIGNMEYGGKIYYVIPKGNYEIYYNPDVYDLTLQTKIALLHIIDRVDIIFDTIPNFPKMHNTSRQSILDNISYILKNYNKPNVNIYEVEKNIFNYINGLDMDTTIKNDIISVLKELFDRTKRKLDEYVEGIKSTKNLNDILEDNSRVEMMVVSDEYYLIDPKVFKKNFFN